MTVEQGWDEANEHQDDGAELSAYEETARLHEEEAAGRRRDIAAFIRDRTLPALRGLRKDLAVIEEIDCAAGCDSCLGSASAEAVASFLADAERSLAAARALLTEGLAQ